MGVLIGWTLGVQNSVKKHSIKIRISETNNTKLNENHV